MEGLNEQAPSSPHAPSKRTVLAASGMAVAVAGVLLVTVVLPAEYGVDPLGTGRALGLTALSGVVVEAPVAPPRGDRLAPVPEGPFALYPGQYKVDSREFTLGPYEYVEYKYHLEEGATMLSRGSPAATSSTSFTATRRERRAARRSRSTSVPVARLTGASRRHSRESTDGIGRTREATP